MASITDIKLLIAENNIEQAATSLLQLARDEPQLLNQVILLKSQFADYNHNLTLNLIERNEQHAKIVNGLLYLADEIGKKNKQQTGGNSLTTNDNGGLYIKGPSELLAVMWLNLHGYITKNLDTVLLSIHPDSPVYAQTADYTKQIFLLDLAYEIRHLEVMNVSKHEARIKMSLETRALTHTAAFKDNLWTGIQYLAPNNEGHWKIWSGDTIELKYIE